MSTIEIGLFTVNKNGNTFQFCQMENTLNGIYGKLDCDYFEVVNCTIGGKRFTIIEDEDGLNKDHPIVSLCHKSAYGRLYDLVGNLIIVSADMSNGEFHSISKDDFELIQKNISHINQINEDTQPTRNTVILAD